jgi:lactoylglutathione lyase
LILSIWHASFTVADLDRSIAFYRDELGLDLVHTQEQANEYTRKFVGYPDAHLKVAQFAAPGAEPPRPGHLSGHLIELVQYVAPEGDPVHPVRYQPGAAHLALQVEDTWEMYERLSANGVHFISEPVAITAGINEGGATVYLEDPDGNTLEFITAPPRRDG